MTKNQLFRKIPPRELVLQVVQAFGLHSLDDDCKFSKKVEANYTVDSINEIKSQLENIIYLVKHVLT